MRKTVQTVIERFATLRKPRAAELTCVALALVVLVLPQWWALERTQAARRAEVQASLELALDSSSALLDSWTSRLEQRLTQAARRSDVIPAATAALEAKAHAAATLQALAADLDPATPGVGIMEYFVVDESAGDENSLAPDATGLPNGQAVVTPWQQAAWSGTGKRPGWALAAWFPLRLESGKAGWLVLRLEAGQAVDSLLKSQDRPAGPKLYAWAPGSGWLGAAGPARQPCSEPPFDRRISEETSAPETCKSDALAAWRGENSLGIALLAEIRGSAAFESMIATRTAIGIFAAVMAVLLLLGAILQTAQYRLPAAQTATRNAAAWGILAVSLLATGLGWLSAKFRFDQYRVSGFESEAKELSQKIVGRLQQYERGLSSAGAFIALPEESPARWREFVRSLNMENRYPAMDCLILIAPESAAASASDLISAGPDACGERAKGAVTRSLKARGPNARQFLSAEIETAPEGLEPVANRLILIQRLPHSERFAAIAALLSTTELLQDLEGLNLDFALEREGRPGEDNLPLFGTAARNRSDHDVSVIDFEFADAHWRLVASRERATPPLAENYPAQILLAGLAISVLLFDIALVLSSTRSRAQGIAQLMTKRFRDSEERIRAVIDHAPDGIITFAVNGTIHTFNPSAERLFGYSQEEASHLSIDRLLSSWRPTRGKALTELASDGGRACIGVRKDSIEFPAELTVSSMQLDDQTLYAAIVRDVTTRRHTEERLRESEERYALAARGANDGLWDWNLRTDEVYYSARWKEIIGFDDREISDRPDEWFQRVHPDDLADLKATLNSHIEARTEFFEGEYRIRHINGGYRWVLSRAVAVRDAYGKATRIAGSQTDITKRKRVEKQLLYDALHDPLTGLPNRTYFMAQLESARQEARRKPEKLFGLLFLDVDRFKVVNDSLGHFVGDQLLVSIAERLKACVRLGDTICRLGGDEFAVLVENLDQVSDATHVAERIQLNLERPLKAGAQDVYAAVSIGIALSSGGLESPEDLLRDADIAMYRAKALGRRRYEMFDQRMHTHAVELLQIETDLRRAVKRGEMEILYQPIYNLAQDRITACEALIRWRHPTRGLLGPRQFISVAEETGVINEIGAWLLDETCRQNAAWRRAGIPLRVSVNVSPRQLLGQDLQQLVLDALRIHELRPDALQLELTESALMESSEANIRPLEELYKHGVQISLDDFGTGYSSLIYLRRFPIHNIKIDQSFVSRVLTDEGDAAIVSGLIELAHRLKLSVIAEGVESNDQMEFLRAHGCDSIQGFVVSRPVKAEDLLNMMRSGFSAASAKTVGESHR